MGLKQPKILLLDDKPIEEENWRRWCKIIGWDVLIYYCSSIKDSLKLLETLEPDVYLIDIFLQNEVGFKFLDVICDRKGLKIVTTNSVNQSDYMKATKYSAFILNKEYDEDENLEIARLIKNLFEKEKSYFLNRDRDLSHSEDITKELTELKQGFKVVQLRITSIEEDYKVLTIKQEEQEEKIKEIVIKQDNSIVNMIVEECIRISKNSNPATKIFLGFLIVVACVTISIYFIYSLVDRE